MFHLVPVFMEMEQLGKQWTSQGLFPYIGPTIPSLPVGSKVVTVQKQVCNTVPDKVCLCHVLPFSLEPQGTEGRARKDSETPKHHQITFVY